MPYDAPKLYRHPRSKRLEDKEQGERRRAYTENTPTTRQSQTTVFRLSTFHNCPSHSSSDLVWAWSMRRPTRVLKNIFRKIHLAGKKKKSTHENQTTTSNPYARPRKKRSSSMWSRDTFSSVSGVT